MPVVSRGPTLGELFDEYGNDACLLPDLRVAVTFTQHTRPRGGGDAGSAGTGSILERSYRAVTDHFDGRTLTEALATTSGAPPLRLVVVSDASASYYSLDRQRYGSLASRTVLFDVNEYRRGLRKVPVILASTQRADGRQPGSTLSATADRSALKALVALTGGEVADDDVLVDHSVRIVLARNEDVCLTYEWALAPPNEGSDFSVAFAISVRCGGGALPAPRPVVDPLLPRLESIDDLWRFARRQLAGPSEPSG